mgnify:FL=1
MTAKQKTEIVTPPCRLSFPALFSPAPVMKGETKVKYQATLLIPPDVDLAPFQECVKAAMMEKFGELIPLRGRANPLKSGESVDYDGYANDWTFIRTSSGEAYPPTVVDQQRNEIIDPANIYAGCWCRFHIVAYAWSHTSGRGVSFSLNAVQLVKDGDRLDGRRAAADVFDAVEVENAPAETPPASDTEALFG